MTDKKPAKKVIMCKCDNYAREIMFFSIKLVKGRPPKIWKYCPWCGDEMKEVDIEDAAKKIRLGQKAGIVDIKGRILNRGNGDKEKEGKTPDGESGTEGHARIRP
jgi:hypothetical protein